MNVSSMSAFQLQKYISSPVASFFFFFFFGSSGGGGFGDESQNIFLHIRYKIKII